MEPVIYKETGSFGRTRSRGRHIPSHRMKRVILLPAWPQEDENWEERKINDVMNGAPGTWPVGYGTNLVSHSWGRWKVSHVNILCALSHSKLGYSSKTFGSSTFYCEETSLWRKMSLQTGSSVFRWGMTFSLVNFHPLVEFLAPISCLTKGLSKITPSPHSSFYGIINVTHSEKIAVGNLLVWPLWSKTDACNGSSLSSCCCKCHHSGANTENDWQEGDWQQWLWG